MGHSKEWPNTFSIPLFRFGCNMRCVSNAQICILHKTKVRYLYNTPSWKQSLSMVLWNHKEEHESEPQKLSAKAKDILKSNEREDKLMLDTKSFLKWPRSDVGERCSRLRVTSFFLYDPWHRRRCFFAAYAKWKRAAEKCSSTNTVYQIARGEVNGKWGIFGSSVFRTNTNVTVCETSPLAIWRHRWYYEITKRNTRWGDTSKTPWKGELQKRLSEKRLSESDEREDYKWC